MYYNQNSVVFLNGNWIKATEAKTDFYIQTLHYGNGAFEGIRSYENFNKAIVLKGKEHFDRLIYSAKKMNINFNYTTDELIQITYELLKKNNLKDAYIRPLVFQGANMSLFPSNEVHLFIAVWEWGKYFGNKLLKVMTSSFQRPNPKSCFIDAKIVGHYTNSILATSEAKSKGYDEALLLDINGFVAEGSGANFFYEKNGILYTPSKGHILPGVTRAVVMELAKEIGMKVEEKFFTIDEVRGSDGAFFTGTAAEVAGIYSLDDIPFKLKWEDTMGYLLSVKYKEFVKSIVEPEPLTA